jgi:hypothetical protein
MPEITPDRVLALKFEARAMSEREGIKRTAALARLAQREGFPSWQALMRAVGGRGVLTEHKLNTDERAAARARERLRRWINHA